MSPDELSAIVGSSHVLTGKDMTPYLTDWRKRRTGDALAVVRPGSTEEVAALVRLCAASGTPIVPQGGNTGQVAGATPDESGRAVVLSTRRLDRIREIDVLNDTMTVEAGCVLQSLHEAAEKADRLFALSLGAKGSCTIGGNLATNAGGTQVLRYGNARELTLGLEVVTPQGEVLDGLRGLRKDNTGYSLRDLYIGSEGTLGIITAATVRLHSRPRERQTAMVALSAVSDALALLQAARSTFGAQLTGFELVGGPCLDLVTGTFPGNRSPFIKTPPWCVLIETSQAEGDAPGAPAMEAMLVAAAERDLIADAVIASSLAQREVFWRLREDITLALAENGFCIKHDIALPATRMGEFLAQAERRVAEIVPEAAPMIFGHLGDGNLHYNLLIPAGSAAEGRRREAEIQTEIHNLVDAAGGSISAEQGIGVLRTSELQRYKDSVALALMMQLKRALDPQGIMNPGAVLLL